MNEFFQKDLSGPESIPLMQHRIVEGEKVQQAIHAELKILNATMNAINTRLALNDKRMDDHSDLHKVITTRIDIVDAKVDNAFDRKTAAAAFWTAITSVAGVVGSFIFFYFKGHGGQ